MCTVGPAKISVNSNEINELCQIKIRCSISKAVDARKWAKINQVQNKETSRLDVKMH